MRCPPWIRFAFLLCLGAANAHATTPRVRHLAFTAAVHDMPAYGRILTGMAQLTLSFDDPPPALHASHGAIGDPARAAHRAVQVLPAELVRRTLHAAYRAAGVGASDAQISAVIARSRWAALLPEINLRGAQYAGLDTILYDPGSNSRSSASNRDQFRDTRTLEARVGWRLDRLVYGGDEPQLEKLRTDRLEIRLRLASKVLEALLLRHRALLDLARWPEGSPEADDAALRLAEAEATLDVLTAGTFSRGFG